MRFDTEAEALEHGRDVFSRWLLATDYRVVDDSVPHNQPYVKEATS
jgi:hypothetical protein